MQFMIRLWLFIAAVLPLNAQLSNDFGEMYVSASNEVYYAPQQTIRICTHILQNSKDDQEKIQALLLNARAHYVQGDLLNSVQNLIDAKVLAESNEDKRSQLDVALFSIHLLNLLELDVVAERYLKNIEIAVNEEDDQQMITLLAGGSSLVDAVKAVQSPDYNAGLNHIKTARSFFEKIPDRFLVNETEISEYDIIYKSVPTDEAMRYFRSRLEDDKNKENVFMQMILLYRLGQSNFDKNSYPKALEFLHKADSISVSLENNQYRGKILELTSLSYMALEETDKFYSVGEEASRIIQLSEANEDNAVNTIFNYINENHARKRDLAYGMYQNILWTLLGIVALFIIVWLVLRYRYRRRSLQYEEFIQYFKKREYDDLRLKPKKEVGKSSTIPKSTEMHLIKKLEQFERSTQFTKQDMSLAYLASQFDTNTRYLSGIINMHKDKNFNSYINELRINYIIDKLQHEPKYLQYKISYLAEECGFTSHSSFATVFKSVTGISPTAFIDIMRSQRRTKKNLAMAYEDD